MQNEQTLQQMIREYETQMPKEILDIVSGFDWKRELREIVRINTVMLDVGADIEESVYLMILGAVSVEDMYERLVDIHQMPKEKAEKVLYEIEDRIFRPLFEKLSKANKPEEEPAVVQDSAPAALKNGVSRDAILAEIEDDGPEIARPINNIVMPGSNVSVPVMQTTAADTSAQAGALGSKPLPELTPVSAPMSDRLGLRDVPDASATIAPKKFSMSDDMAVEVNKVGIADSMTMAKPVTATPSQAAPIAAPVMQGMSADPISSGLTGSTATASPQATPTAKPVSYAADPYREPIE